jgi:Fur family iron response transcriptional regulator
MDTSSPPKAAKPAAFSCDAVASSKPISYMLQMKRIWLAPIGLAVLGTRKMALTRTVVIPNIKAGPERSPDRSALTGCPWHDVKAMLREVGLRPTRQRMALGWILFGKGDRHLTAEMLYEEATRAKVPVSLATIYNTLHQFTEVGLLRQVAVDGTKAYFDTNVTAHHHFFVEGEDELLDIPDAEVLVGKTPTPPEGFEIARIDVVVRLRRKS